MNLKKSLVVFVMASSLLVMTGKLGAQNGPDAKGKLEGTWDVTSVDGDFVIRERFTFQGGKTGNDGTLIFSTEFDLSAPLCGSDQGVWVRTGRREFATTHNTFCNNAETGQLEITVKTKDVIMLNEKGDEFTGMQRSELYDPDGKLLESFDYTMKGKRMAVEPVTPAKPFDAESERIGTTGAARGRIWSHP